MTNPRSRFIAPGVYTILVVMMLLLFYRFTVQNNDRIQLQNLEYADDALRQIALRIDDQFKNAQDLIETYVYFLEHTLTKPEISSDLLKEIEQTTPFDGIHFTTVDGMNYSADGDITGITDSEYFQEGMNGKSGAAVIMKSRVFNQAVIGFYAPVRYKGKVIGVLHGSYLSSKFLRDMLEASYFGKPANVYLCMPDGQIIATSAEKPWRGNLLEELVNYDIIDKKTAGEAMSVFQHGGSGSYICKNNSKSDNLCLMMLPQYKYVLAQTYPQSVTQGMLKRANTAGFELETGLLVLFAVCGGILLVQARLQKKWLEGENRDLGMLLQGINTLYSGRYCTVNTRTGTYAYIANANAPSEEKRISGEYSQLLEDYAIHLAPGESRKEFLEFFSLKNIMADLARHDAVTYLCHVTRDGEQLWENIITVCLDRENGAPVNFMILRQNVTDMKQRELKAQDKISEMNRKERQYQLALTSNAMCSYEFNVSRDLLEDDVRQVVNGRSVSMTQARGCAVPCRASEFLESWLPLILPESREEYERKTSLQWLRDKFYEGRKEVELDFWIQEAGSGEICVRQSFYMTNNDSDNDIMAMTVLRDITAQVVKQRSQTKALQDALMLAQHANEAKTIFLSNMSHDIRTPMNAIIGFSTIAASHLDNRAQVGECLQKVLSSSNHLLSLINDILDMSRIESGKMQIKEQPCNISELMHNLVTIIQPQVKAKQMKLFIDSFDVTNEDVITDPLKLNQIFINLLGNAVKYTPAGGEISFRLTQKPAFRHGYADYEFQVTDNGIGMSKEFVQHIFEPFTRESTTTQTGIQGTGLGMAITKNIVEMMNGDIKVESSPGKGSNFIVTLTLKLQDSTNLTASIKELEGMRALVVDDDFHVCDSVNKMLKKIGLRPEWTTSGREAVYRTQIAYADNDPIRTFIIDWQMPDMNGVETARRIRSIVGEDAPIIILTAYEWTDIEQEAREAGVSAFCAKPLFMSDLKNALLSGHNLGEKPDIVPQEKARFKNARILLVDDLEMNREVAGFILEESGFIVDMAPDGTDAVEMVSQSPENYYSAILMDVQMPTMNGYEATRTIRNLSRGDVKNIPIIAMTANALEEDKAEALKAGMNEHIAKPIDMKNFFEILSKYFQKQ